MTPAISIIIPIYNGEKYLKQCLDSIVRQTFTNFEVLLINDGSTDNSQSILDWYKEKDERFKTYQIPNSGVSHARNVGLSMATGDFIFFVDSDDWIEEDAIEYLLNQFVSQNISIVLSAFSYDYFDKTTDCHLSANILTKKQISSFPLAIFVPETASINDVKLDVEILCAMAGKMYRRDFIEKHKIRFNKHVKIGEDGLFVLEVLLKSQDFRIVNKRTYHYVMREGSAMLSVHEDIHRENNIQYYNSYKSLVQYVPIELRKYYMSLVSYRCYYSLMTLFVGNKYLGLSFSSQRKILKKTLNNSDIYNIGPIPSFIPLKKYLDILALKRRWYYVLIIINKIRQHKK